MTATPAPDPLKFGLRMTTPGPGAMPPPTLGRPLPPKWPAKVGMSRKELEAKAGKRGITGDIYGLPLPRTPSEVRSFGADWLTKCFRAAGTLAPSNSVVKIVEAFELPVHAGADCAGGAGRKMFLTVDYAEP